MKNINENNKVKYTTYIQPHMKMVSELGLYMILDKSKKPKAL